MRHRCRRSFVREYSTFLLKRQTTRVPCLAPQFQKKKKSSSFTGRLSRRDLRPKHLEDIKDAKTPSNKGSGKSLDELTRLCNRRTMRLTWDKLTLPKERIKKEGKNGETKERKWKINNIGNGKALYRCVVGANHSKKFVQQITALFDCPGDSADRQSVGDCFLLFFQLHYIL